MILSKKLFWITFVTILPIILSALLLYSLYLFSAPSRSLTIAAGPKGGAFEETALRYRKALARSGIRLDVRFTSDMLDNFQLVKNSNSGVDFALLFGGITNQNVSPNLRSMGRVAFSPLWFFYRGNEILSRLSQLSGKEIAIGPAIRPILIPILQANGINTEGRNIHNLAGTDAANALLAGQIDVAPLPFEYDSPTIQMLLHDPQIKLMNLEQIEAMTRIFPFLTQLTLPRGVVDIRNDIPAEDIKLIAVTNAIVTRDDLDPELIDALAGALTEVHGGAGIFNKAGAFPTTTDPEFSIHQNALDYYRNGPPTLSKYFPFRISLYGTRALAIFVAVFAVAIPMFGYVQSFYQWATGRYLYSQFRDLGTLMLECEHADSLSELGAIEARILTIDERLTRHSLYLYYSAMALPVESRLDGLRLRIAERKRSFGLNPLVDVKEK